jgi:hypothetical protein
VRRVDELCPWKMSFAHGMSHFSAWPFATQHEFVNAIATMRSRYLNLVGIGRQMMGVPET